VLIAEKLIDGLPRAFPAEFTFFDLRHDDIRTAPSFKASLLRSLATTRAKSSTSCPENLGTPAPKEEVLSEEEVEAFINEIEVLKDSDGKVIGRKYFKPFGGWLAEVKDDEGEKIKELVFQEPLFGACDNDACQQKALESMHFRKAGEEDGQSLAASPETHAIDTTEEREGSEEGAGVNTKLVAFRLREMEPDLYPISSRRCPEKRCYQRCRKRRRRSMLQK
jgi:hypothetical protein